MSSRWKSWLAVGSVLLAAGAGCPGPGERTTDTKTESTLGAKADAAFDAALEESSAASAQDLEESADADIVTNDSAELNAYGQAYDQNAL